MKTGTASSFFALMSAMFSLSLYMTIFRNASWNLATIWFLHKDPVKCSQKSSSWMIIKSVGFILSTTCAHACARTHNFNLWNSVPALPPLKGMALELRIWLVKKLLKFFSFQAGEEQLFPIATAIILTYLKYYWKQCVKKSLNAPIKAVWLHLCLSFFFSINP